MDIGSISTRAGTYWGLDNTPAATVSSDFVSALEQVEQTERAAAYIDHLRSKYGAHFRIESIPRDPKVLERVGGRMSGDDVVIAPNIVAEMAQNPEKAAYYEGTIDHCFDSVPALKQHFAAKGMTFEPCGVVVHEDGTVTFICGGGDSPERVAQVNAINAAKDAKRAAQRREWQEEHLEHTLEIREMNEAAAQAHAFHARLQRTHAASFVSPIRLAAQAGPAQAISEQTADGSK